jgi:hypothetical protein
MAGPFNQEGRDFAGLFDFSFGPETVEAQNVKWKPLPTDPGCLRPWLVDLRGPIGRELCAAYAQTWLHCDSSQSVQLELGSDSAVKVWITQKVVHASSAVRALHPGSDRIESTLPGGWSRVLVKVVQPNQGGSFCLRLLKPDGAPLADLRIDAARKTKD